MIRLNATSAFAAERQVVGRTGDGVESARTSRGVAGGEGQPPFVAHLVTRPRIALVAIISALSAGWTVGIARANCPGGKKIATVNQSRLPSSVLDVSAEAPCVATFWIGVGGISIVTVTDPRPGTTTCHVTGHLEGGRQVAAVVTFRETMKSGCRTISVTGDSFTLRQSGGRSGW